MATKAKRQPARLHLLTTREVQSAPVGDHGDGGGLLLRVTESSCSWVFRYTSTSGKRREMGLGTCHRGSVSQAGAAITTARDLAHKARELLRQGIDPIEARDGHREVAKQAVEQAKAQRQRDRWTLARASRDYHRRVIEPSRTAKHSAQWIASLENHVPPTIWQAPIDTIDAPKLLAALQEVTPHERARNLKGDGLPETVRRIRQRLDAVFEDAIFHGRATFNPAAAVRRKLREGAPRREKGKMRALPFCEAPALMQALRSAGGTSARALEFAVLTAARTTEVLEAEWNELDLATGIWTVPAKRMKAKESHEVFLSLRAVQVLRGQLGQDLRYVFPSPASMGKADGQRKPMSNMAMLTVLDRLGYRSRTTVHGLARATFSTWANETGAGRPDVIEACLAHEEGNRVRAAYNRATFKDERRRLLAVWADFVSTPPAPVAAMERRSA